MRKIIYLVKRVFTMDYKKMIVVLRRLHIKTGKGYLFLILDIFMCGLKYQSGYMDYELFAMYELSGIERETILTRGKNNILIRKYNDPSYRSNFSDKGKFNKLFCAYLKREWIILDQNEEAFLKFIENKKEIIAKPVNGTCGKGIEKITVADHEDLYTELLEKNLLLVEEVIRQSDKMNLLYDRAVSTIRFVSIYLNGKAHFVTSYLRIGNGSVVDNFNHGGMVVPVDIETGKISLPAVDKNGTLYEVHPVSETSIIGFQIPNWSEVLKLVEELAPKVPEIGLVGWDIAIGPDGPVVVEGNEFPGHDIYQLPPHRPTNEGVYPLFMKIEKEQ